jgi:hypothetical protein
LRLSDEVDMLKSLLEGLDNMSRTLYEEEALRKQFVLTIARACGDYLNNVFYDYILLIS